QRSAAGEFFHWEESPNRPKLCDAQRCVGAGMVQRSYRLKRWRHRVYEVLDHGPVGDRAARLMSRFLILLVLVNIAAVVLESVPRYAEAYDAVFVAIEIVSTVVFTAEYALRIWVAAEHAPNRQLMPRQARLRYL